MKRFFLFALAASLALLCSCAASDDAQPSGPDPAHSTDSPATESQEATVIENIEEYLSGLGYEIVKSKESSSMLEFMVTLPGFSDQDLTEPPENWEDVRTAFLEAESGAAELSAELPIVLYLQDNDGNNCLTLSGGKEKFSVFKSYSSDGYNPPTITLEEYNAIKTGMTFQEVYDIIGGPGEVLSEVDLNIGEEYHTVMKKWDGEGDLGANANITFQGGKVTGKAQYGLE